MYLAIWLRKAFSVVFESHADELSIRTIAERPESVLLVPIVSGYDDCFNLMNSLQADGFECSWLIRSAKPDPGSIHLKMQLTSNLLLFNRLEQDLEFVNPDQPSPASLAVNFAACAFLVIMNTMRDGRCCAMSRTTTMTVRLGCALSDFVSANAGEDGSCANVSEHVRDLVRRDKEQTEVEAFNRLKAELTHAFAALEETHKPLTASEVIARN